MLKVRGVSFWPNCEYLTSTTASDSAGDPTGLGKMFSDPNLLGKLAANPKTAKHLADPSFVRQLQMLQSNPNLAGTYVPCSISISFFIHESIPVQSVTPG
jgi:hypothetical protein